MDEREPEAGFLPFVPRRVSGGYGPTTGGLTDPQEPQPAEAPAEATGKSPTTDQRPPPLDVAESQQAGEPIMESEPPERPETGLDVEAPATELAAQDNSLVVPSQPALCRHEHLIRNEAIRLAAIACGRALRHAALIHPQVIARFVDDALEAAGNPKSFSIGSNGSDGALDFGEVLIQCDGSFIGAELETRAELLVRAAACA